MTDTTPPAGLLSIDQAADALGTKPWDVVRLIESGDIESVELVKADSLDDYRKAGQ